MNRLKPIKVVDLKRSIFEDNDKDAARLRASLKKRGTFLLNVMSSPGSGKTTTLVGLIRLLKNEMKIAVMEADIDSDKDARCVAELTGVKSVQLHTGGMCHLDADMTRQGLKSLAEKHGSNSETAENIGKSDRVSGNEAVGKNGETGQADEIIRKEAVKIRDTAADSSSNTFDCGDYDLVILENVGNLVCPAEFDTGAVKNLTILSVPEGDDKLLKYPLMYQVSSALVINKIDVLPYFDFNPEKVKEYALRRNPGLDIFTISAKTGEGLEALADWVRTEVKRWKTE